jgi:membrane protein
MTAGAAPAHGLSAATRGRLKLIAQRLLFAAERFGGHEMANHAAAGAYAFLLSATPAALLVIGAATAIAAGSPERAAGAADFVAEFLGPLDAAGAAAHFFSRGLGPVAILVGVASLAWAARLFVVAVQRGLRVIWSASGKNAAAKENALSFVLELVAIVAAVAMFLASRAVNLVADRLYPLLGGAAGPALRAFATLSSPAALLAFVYMSYRLAPSTPPRRGTAARAALLCTASFAIFSMALRQFARSDRYDLLYGVLGSLILLLVNIYTFFSLYFYFAELAYVEDHFDALLFGRFFRVSSRETRRGSRKSSAEEGKPGAAARLERALFMEPDRLLRAYGRPLAAGEAVFEAGDTGRQAYFVYRGHMGVYLPLEGGEREIGSIGPGEVFGEMASVLEENRTATVRALVDSYLIELTPEVFDLYLKTDAEASMRLVDMLAGRLKSANARTAARAPRAEGEASAAAPRDRSDG